VGPLGGKWRQLVGKVGEWYVESRHLQGCSPAYVGYGPMGWPGKPSSRLSIEA
jgi:hypothetical protein